MNNNFNLKQYLSEGKLLNEIEVGIYRGWDSDTPSLGFLFHPEEDDDGMIDYFYDKDKIIEVIENLGYDDAEEVAKEFINISSPSDELKFMRNMTNNPNLQIKDLTIGMFEQNIEEEFPKYI